MRYANIGRLGVAAALFSAFATNALAQTAAAPAEETYAQQMAREQREHPTLKIGSPAPDFNLMGIDDKMHTLGEYSAAPILAIAPNGPMAVAPRELNYAEVDDSFDSMKIHASYREFNFPYLYEGDTQQVAHQYGPKVTPHIFIFDRDRKLRYEGRIDDNMRGNNIKTSDARNAIDALLAGKPVPVEHTPVFGCSTKWNSAIAGKQKEMKEWMAQPVTLKSVSLDELKQLRKNPTGKTLMINFWATWCGPCQTEYPELLTSYLWYRSRDFEFVSVALNTPDEKAAAQKFLDEKHSAVRNLIIDTDDVYAVMAAFDPTWESGVPFTIVLAPDGHELYRSEGEADILALRRKILGNLPDAGMFAGNTEYWRK